MGLFVIHELAHLLGSFHFGKLELRFVLQTRLMGMIAFVFITGNMSLKPTFSPPTISVHFNGFKGSLNFTGRFSNHECGVFDSVWYNISQYIVLSVKRSLIRYMHDSRSNLLLFLSIESEFIRQIHMRRSWEIRTKNSNKSTATSDLHICLKY